MLFASFPQTVSVTDLRVCIDCHNYYFGELRPNPAPTDDAHRPWNTLEFGYDVRTAGEHGEACDTDMGRCDCNHDGFSWSSCDGCNSPLGGDRYRYELLAATDEIAREHHRALIMWARIDNTIGDRVWQIDEAGMWRRFLASRMYARPLAASTS